MQNKTIEQKVEILSLLLENHQKEIKLLTEMMMKVYKEIERLNTISELLTEAKNLQHEGFKVHAEMIKDLDGRIK